MPPISFSEDVYKRQGLLHTVTVQNVHPNTTVALRMNGLSGAASDLKLYGYNAKGKLVEIPTELWKIQQEDGTTPTNLKEDTLYEIHVVVEDGGTFDLSDTAKEMCIRDRGKGACTTAFFCNAAYRLNANTISFSLCGLENVVFF